MFSFILIQICKLQCIVSKPFSEDNFDDSGFGLLKALDQLFGFSLGWNMVRVTHYQNVYAGCESIAD